MCKYCKQMESSVFGALRGGWAGGSWQVWGSEGGGWSGFGRVGEGAEKGQEMGISHSLVGSSSLSLQFPQHS